jgi:hypothetical protein
MKTLLLVLLTFLIGCEDTPDYLKGKKIKTNLSASTDEVKLPAKLWEELEAIYRPPILDQSRKEEEGSRAKLEIPKEFFGFTVYLVQKNKGVLKRGDHEIVFEKGGGTIDLNDFLTDQKGSFYLGFRPQLELEKTDKVSIYFLSNSKLINIDGEVHGGGCEKFMDITTYFNERMKTQGILVNTAKQRHIGLIAGTYFFAASINGKLLLSRLSIKDSRFKKFHCQWR